MKRYKKIIPFLALFALAVLAVILIRSVKEAKDNNVSYFKVVWYEIKFLFSFASFAPKFE